MVEQSCPLTQVFSEVLANMAFLFTAPRPEFPPPEDGWLECTIGYRGPERGSLRLRCSDGFGRLLAANLLGLQPNSPEALGAVEDTVKELLNVLCGRMTTAIYGHQTAFDLEVPRLIRLAAVPPPRENTADSVEFYVEGHSVQLVHERE